MAKYLYENAAAVPAHLKNEVEPVTDEHGTATGQMRLKVEDMPEGMEIADTRNLKKSLASERKAAADAKALLKKWEGLEPEDARDAMKKLTELAAANPEGKAAAQLEAVKKQLTDKHSEEMRMLAEELEEAEAELHRVLVIAEAEAAIAKTGCPSPKLVLPHVIEGATVVRDEATGRRRVVYTDPASGTPILSTKPGSTDTMTIAERVEVMRKSKDFAPAFPASGASGARGPAAGAKGTGEKPVTGKGSNDQPVSATQLLREQRQAASASAGM